MHISRSRKRDSDARSALCVRLSEMLLVQSPVIDSCFELGIMFDVPVDIFDATAANR